MTDSNFRLSKSDKRVLASTPHKNRATTKNMMIEAQVSFNKSKTMRFKDKNDKGEKDND